MANSITVHFEGPIAEDHTVDLRSFTKTLLGLQSALERAHLDIKNDGIAKHARKNDEDYEKTALVLKQTREGGFIADLVGKEPEAKVALARVYQAVAPAYEAAGKLGVHEKQDLVAQAKIRGQHVKAGAQRPMPFSKLVESSADSERAFGDRSIVKEFDQIASTIRNRNGDGSYLEITIASDKAHPMLVFDTIRSKRFHEVVSERKLGDPVLLEVRLRALDAGSGTSLAKSKMYNCASGKEFNALVPSPRAFGSLRKYLKKKEPPKFSIVACPVLEYGTFDPEAGDMVMLFVWQDDSTEV